MSGSILQSVAGVNAGASSTATAAFTSNLSAGSVLLVAGVGAATAGIPTLTVADNAAGGTNTYTQLLSASINANARCALFSAPLVNGVGTKPTVTLTSSQATSGVALVIMEAAGIANVIDASGTATGSAANASVSTSTTTTAASELGIGVYGDDGASLSVTAGAGWTLGATDAPSGVEEVAGEFETTGASGSTVTASFTVAAAPHAAFVAVFQLSTSIPDLIMAPAHR
jgi:hypothetical protein